VSRRKEMDYVLIDFDVQASINRLTVDMERINALPPCITEKQCARKKILLDDLTLRMAKVKMEAKVHMQRFDVFERNQ
jgi:hypothetical protein